MSATNRPKFEAPLYIAWEVTLQCNARCLHCYSESGPGVHHPNELSTKEAIKIIGELADADLLILAFSGGEPLLRRDIFQLIETASHKGLVVNVATNGAIINDRIARRLKAAGVSSMTVSLDGSDADTHDYFRQVPGLFDRTKRAVELLVKNDLRVVVSFTPSKLNYEQGPDVVRLAYELGASAVNMSEFVPCSRSSKNVEIWAPPTISINKHEKRSSENVEIWAPPTH